MNKNIFKSAGAVIAGFIVVVILSVATDFILEKLGIFPQQSDPGAATAWMLFTALLYRTLFTIAGGYVTAFLSPNRPMKQVTILGIIGTLAGIGGAIGGWNLSSHWYPVML